MVCTGLFFFLKYGYTIQFKGVKSYDSEKTLQQLLINLSYKISLIFGAKFLFVITVLISRVNQNEDFRNKILARFVFG